MWCVRGTRAQSIRFRDERLATSRVRVAGRQFAQRETLVHERVEAFRIHRERAIRCGDALLQRRLPPRGAQPRILRPLEMVRGDDEQRGRIRGFERGGALECLNRPVEVARLTVATGEGVQVGGCVLRVD